MLSKENCSVLLPYPDIVLFLANIEANSYHNWYSQRIPNLGKLLAKGYYLVKKDNGSNLKIKRKDQNKMKFVFECLKSKFLEGQTDFQCDLYSVRW